MINGQLKLSVSLSYAVYFVNWQRKISLQNYEGHPAIVKTNKGTKGIHELLLIISFCLLSFMIGHPVRPNLLAFASRNEGREIRQMLEKMGVDTPRLYSISEKRIVEEYIEGGDLHSSIRRRSESADKAYDAGCATGIMHRAGLVFIDNKAQNYLVGTKGIVRTDLAFIQKSSSLYSRSIDIASFLASVIDLDCYPELENYFFEGYKKEAGMGFPYLSIILRNILSLGLSSNPTKMIRNFMKNSDRLLSY